MSFISRLAHTTIALVFFVMSHMALAADELVNINTATAQELAQVLVGVGTSRAQAIVQYRETYGDFIHPEDLLLVKGIGDRVLETNRGRIVIGE